MAGDGKVNTFGEQKPLDPWFGYERFSATLGAYPVEVIKAPITWDRRHVERLLKTAETSGLVPTLNATLDGGHLQLAQLLVFSPTLHQRLAMSRNLGWGDAAGLVAAAARAVDNGHLLGLRHGGLSPKSISITSEAVGVKGMGLSRDGTLPRELEDFAAPEVIAGEAPGVRSDVYSLGRILLAALESTSGPSPAALLAVVEKATSQDLLNRFPTAAALAEAVAEAGGNNITAFELANFGVAAIGGVPDGLPVPVGLFSGDTIIDLTDHAPETAGPDSDGITIVPEAEAVAKATPASVAKENYDGGSGWGLLAALLAAGALVVAAALWIGSSDSEVGSTTTAAATTTASGSTTIAPTTAEPSTSITTEPPTTTEILPTTEPPATTEPPTTEPSTSITTEPSTTTEAPTTTEPPATTTEPSTSITTEPSTTTEAPTTTEPPATVDEVAPVELLHGLPEANYDIYANGELVVPALSPQTIAGPLDLPTGSELLEVFDSIADAPTESAERTDESRASNTADLTPGQATSAIVHFDAAGNPVLSVFADNHSEIPAGQSRVTVRHLAGAGPLQLLIDGEPVGSTIANGEQVEFEIPAGEHDVVLLDGAGTELLASRLTASAGSATTISAVTGSDGELVALVQRVDGLGAPPGEVPTGDSGLKDVPDTSGLGLVLLILGITVASATAGAMWQRNRTR